MKVPYGWFVHSHTRLKVNRDSLDSISGNMLSFYINFFAYALFPNQTASERFAKCQERHIRLEVVYLRCGLFGGCVHTERGEHGACSVVLFVAHLVLLCQHVSRVFLQGRMQTNGHNMCSLFKKNHIV